MCILKILFAKNWTIVLHYVVKFNLYIFATCLVKLEINLRINLIPLRYPMIDIPCRNTFNWRIKHWSSNLKVPILDIEIKHWSSNLKVPIFDIEIKRLIITISRQNFRPPKDKPLIFITLSMISSWANIRIRKWKYQFSWVKIRWEIKLMF